MPGLTPGRIVHYVLPEHERNGGEHRPAIIVHVWPNASNGLVQLGQFTDFANDNQPSGIVWRASVPYSDEAKPGTWHWIEPA